MVREGTEFVVFDAKSNDDLTRQILTQIIFEEESRGEALLPVQFLRQLIGFYGGQMQGVLPSYLEMSLDAFSRQQEQLRGQFKTAFGAAPGATLMDEAVRRNMAMFEQAMRMFPGFAYGRSEDGTAPAASEDPAASPAADPLAEMRRQMDEMRAQIDRLSAMVAEAEIRFDQAELWRDAGSGSLRGWMADHCGLGRRAATAEARRVER
jgi:polyhydroxyalkanoate synthesis repressor PhaR